MLRGGWGPPPTKQLQQKCSADDSTIRELQIAKKSLQATAAEATQALDEVVELARQEIASAEGKRLRLADALITMQREYNEMRKALHDSEVRRAHTACCSLQLLTAMA